MRKVNAEDDQMTYRQPRLDSGGHEKSAEEEEEDDVDDSICTGKEDEAAIKWIKEVGRCGCGEGCRCIRLVVLNELT